ncbi:MAG: Rab family GTPase [Candidatus Thorarchaeota archaeon]
MREIQKMRFKVLVIGDNHVGKTSLLRKFTQGRFEKDYVKTLGAEFSKYDKEIDGFAIRLIFWHIAGGKEFLYLRSTLVSNTNAAIIMYSLEDCEEGRESFSHIAFWYNYVFDYTEDIPMYLFANKVDLVEENSINKVDIEQVVEEYNLQGYYFTSAVTGGDVMKAFDDISLELYKKAKEKQKQENGRN